VVKTINYRENLLNLSDNIKSLVNSKISRKEQDSGVFQLFDKMAMSHFLEVYLSSSKFDCILFIKLKDEIENKQTLQDILKIKH